MMVRKEEFTFDSRDGKTKIHAIRWVPEGKMACILQIVHGMAEHMERYEEMAEYLAGKGILVTGEDHLGHGQSISENGKQGYFCEQDPATVVVRDVHRLKKINQEKYPGVPYVILGHSMGSFILRNYLLRYGTGIQGAIICATGSLPKATLRVGHLLAKIQYCFLGSKHEAKILDKIAFGANNKRITNPRTQLDWLCVDDKVVDTYLEDSSCGFTFTVNGFQTLFTLIDRLNEEEALKAMPLDLPIFFIAGTEDPVGDYGRGVKQVYDEFLKLGMKKVSLKMYEGGRHEILNEPVKYEIYEKLYSWMMERVEEY